MQLLNHWHNSHRNVIHVQYSNIMRFLVRHNRHHKVSQSVPLFKSRKTVTIFLRIKVGGHFVMSIVKCHESYYVGVLDNPQKCRLLKFWPPWWKSTAVKSWAVLKSFFTVTFSAGFSSAWYFSHKHLSKGPLTYHVLADAVFPPKLRQTSESVKVFPFTGKLKAKGSLNSALLT